MDIYPRELKDPLQGGGFRRSRMQTLGQFIDAFPGFHGIFCKIEQPCPRGRDSHDRCHFPGQQGKAAAQAVDPALGRRKSRCHPGAESLGRTPGCLDLEFQCPHLRF